MKRLARTLLLVVTLCVARSAQQQINPAIQQATVTYERVRTDLGQVAETEGQLRKQVARDEPLARAESLENQGQVNMAVAQNKGAQEAALRGEEARLQQAAADGQIAAARDRSAAESKRDWAAREGRNGAGYGEKAAEHAGEKYEKSAESDRDRARSAGDAGIEGKAGERAEVNAYRAGMEKDKGAGEFDRAARQETNMLRDKEQMMTSGAEDKAEKANVASAEAEKRRLLKQLNGVTEKEMKERQERSKEEAELKQAKLEAQNAKNRVTQDEDAMKAAMGKEARDSAKEKRYENKEEREALKVQQDKGDLARDNQMLAVDDSRLKQDARKINGDEMAKAKAEVDAGKFDSRRRADEAKAAQMNAAAERAGVEASDLKDKATSDEIKAGAVAAQERDVKQNLEAARQRVNRDSAEVNADASKQTSDENEVTKDQAGARKAQERAQQDLAKVQSDAANREKLARRGTAEQAELEKLKAGAIEYQSAVDSAPNQKERAQRDSKTDLINKATMDKLEDNVENTRAAEKQAKLQHGEDLANLKNDNRKMADQEAKEARSDEAVQEDKRKQSDDKAKLQADKAQESEDKTKLGQLDAEKNGDKAKAKQEETEARDERKQEDADRKEATVDQEKADKNADREEGAKNKELAADAKLGTDKETQERDKEAASDDAKKKNQDTEKEARDQEKENKAADEEAKARQATDQDKKDVAADTQARDKDAAKEQEAKTAAAAAKERVGALDGDLKDMEVKEAALKDRIAALDAQIAADAGKGQAAQGQEGDAKADLIKRRAALQEALDKNQEAQKLGREQLASAEGNLSTEDRAARDKDKADLAAARASIEAKSAAEKEAAAKALAEEARAKEAAAAGAAGANGAAATTAAAGAADAQTAAQGAGLDAQRAGMDQSGALQTANGDQTAAGGQRGLADTAGNTGAGAGPGAGAGAGPGPGGDTGPGTAQLSGGPVQTTSQAATGNWQPPAEVLAAAKAGGSIAYDAGGPYNGGANCAGAFKSGTRAIQNLLQQRFPGAATSYGGYSCRPNTANRAKMSEHGSGRAIDIMITPVGGRADAGKGDPMANYLVANAAKLGVQYLIWNRMSWNQHTLTFRAYTGPNPHTDHIHMEINNAAAGRSSITDPGGNVPGTTPGSVNPNGASQTPGSGPPGATQTSAVSPVIPTTSGPSGAQLVTADQIRCAMECSAALAQQYAGLVNQALVDSQATTYPRVIMWLAQMGHESMGLQAMTERGSNCQRYENRRNLGNNQPGDGCKFKGRGPIQLTGRANYRDCGAAIGQDLVGNPDLVATPEIGFKTASWYWRTRRLNPGSDRGDIVDVTYRINGGDNGLADRRRRFALAQRCIPQGSLGSGTASTAAPAATQPQPGAVTQQPQQTQQPQLPDAPAVLPQGGQCQMPAASPCGNAYIRGVDQGPQQCIVVGNKPVTARSYCALMALQAAMRAAGIPFVLNSAFRRMDEQERLYNLYRSGRGNLAARPGFSNHQNGIAFDINQGPGVFRWMSQNASRYGFIRAVDSENWHWEWRPGQRCNAIVRYSCS